MGAWGTKLYEDDEACDLQALWKEMLQDGLSSEDATAELRAQWGDAEGPVFWLALADQQWSSGRLLPEVQQRALATIEDGSDLALWQEESARKARARVLEGLRKRLSSRAPRAKPVRSRNPDAVAWAPGQTWSYRMLDGQYAVLRVAAIDPHYGLVPAPMVELLDLVGPEPPAASEVGRAGLRRAKLQPYAAIAKEHQASPLFQIKVTRRRELPRHRLKQLRGSSQPRPATDATKALGVTWDNLDSLLVQHFGVGCWMPGTVLSHRLPDGNLGLVEIDTVRWLNNVPEPFYQLGILDLRGKGEGGALSAKAIAGSRRVSTGVVFGFPPRERLREVGARPPQHVELPVFAHQPWDALPELFAAPRPGLDLDALKALMARHLQPAEEPGPSKKPKEKAKAKATSRSKAKPSKKKATGARPPRRSR